MDNHDAFDRNPFDVAFNCTLRTIINNYSKVLELNASLRAALAINISHSASACR